MTMSHITVCYRRTKTSQHYRFSYLEYDSVTEQIGVYNWKDMLGHNQSFVFCNEAELIKNIKSIVTEHYNKTGNCNCWRKVKSFIEKSGILERFYDWYLCNFAIAIVPKEDVAKDFMLWCKGQYYKAVKDVPRELKRYKKEKKNG